MQSNCLILHYTKEDGKSKKGPQHCHHYIPIKSSKIILELLAIQITLCSSSAINKHKFESDDVVYEEDRHARIYHFIEFSATHLESKNKKVATGHQCAKHSDRQGRNRTQIY